MPQMNRHTRDEGFTLIEMLVSFFMITLLVLAVGTLWIRASTAQAASERTDKAVAAGQAVVAKASQTPYSSLGYYADDTNFTAGTKTLPLWQTATGAIIDNPDTCTGGSCPTKITETQVLLGASRPATEPAPFAKRVDTQNNNGVAYRLDTWVTFTADGAKRVTVQTEWPAADGTCTTTGARCITQSYVRAPLSSEQDPSGVPATSSCPAGTAAICQTYVQSGRVLGLESQADLTRYPAQIHDVILFARTNSAATAMKASWTWTGLDGSTTNVTIPSGAVTFSQVDGDPTRWKTVIPADPADGTTASKLWIRPGRVTVTFQATIGGVAATAARDAQWSYASAIPVTASASGSPGACSSTGSGTPTTVAVSGLSIGYGALGATTSQSAADVVTATFTVTQGGAVQAITVPATLVTRAEVYQYASTKVRGGYVDATFQMQSPRDEACPNSSSTAVVNVSRTTDGTTTPFNLSLLPAVVAGPVGVPVASVTVDQPTGQVNAAWTAVTSATYLVEWSIDDVAWPSEGGNASNSMTTAAVNETNWTTIGIGHTFRFRVAALTSGGQSAWSNEARVVRVPAVPTVTGTRTAITTGTFTWPAVTGATDYWVTYNDGSGWVSAGAQTTLTYVAAIQQGTTTAVGVVARTAAGSSAAGTASVSIPLMEPFGLLNSWTNFGGGYEVAQFTKTTQGIVSLVGLIHNGDITSGTVIGVLPVGYRPNYRLIFSGATNGTTVTRLDVDTNGNIYVMSPPPTAAGWISLGGITFLAAGSPTVMTSLTPGNGWVWGGWAPFQAAVDPLGRVHVQGMLNTGTNTDNTVISMLPSNMQSDQYLHLAGLASNGQGVTGMMAGVLAKTSNPTGGWTSIQAIFQSSANSAKWLPLSLQNSWVQYVGYATPQYQKGADGFVTLRGLLRSGDVANGTVITTLPPGYRPSQMLIFDVANNMHYARLDIFPTGEVVVREGVDNAWIALESINFVAEG